MVQLASLPSSGTRLSAQWVGVDTWVGHVFVSGVDATGQGGMSMLDARTGAVLRTVPVGARPWCLAVDERTARAFMVNQQDRTVSVLDVGWIDPLQYLDGLTGVMLGERQDVK